MPRKISLSSPDITESEIEMVNNVLRTKHLSMGPYVADFEKELADYIGCKHSVAVNSGTSALHLCMRAIGLKDGDEVITSPFSFISSSNCILFERGVPLFVDIDPLTMNMDPAGIEEKITEKTKAILPVHIFGQPCDMAPIMKIAEEHDLVVIEDACEAIGAEYMNKKVGTFGLASTFAFYPNKQMTTGEGGMVVTDDDEVAKLCRSMRNQGRSESNIWLAHERLGYNYRMDEISAALGLGQIRRLEDMLALRKKVAETYNDHLSGQEHVEIPYVIPGVKMSWFVYVIRLSANADRNKLMEYLASVGIDTRPYFSPLHLQPFYRSEFGFAEGDFPVCESIAGSTLALPFHNNLSEDDIIYVCQSIVSGLREQGL